MPQKQVNKPNSSTSTVKNPPKRVGSAKNASKAPASASEEKSQVKKQTKATDKTKTATQERVINPEQSQPDPSSLPNQVIPYLLGFVALFLTVCYILESKMGIFGHAVNSLFFGFFSGAAIGIPIFIMIIAIFWRRDIVKRSVKFKVIFSFLILTFISVLIYIFSRPDDQYSIVTFWEMGRSWKCGGVIGGTVGWLMLKAVGSVGTIIISVAMILLFGIFMFGLTPYGVWIFAAYHIHEYRRRKREERAQKNQPVYHVKPLPNASQTPPPEPLPGSLTKPEHTKSEPAH